MDIFHIVDEKSWRKAKESGTYKPDSLMKEGFIHLSKADQLLAVANSFYRYQKNLVILRIDSAKLIHELKVEPPLEAPFSGVLYPHLYGELNLDAVDDVIDFPCLENGSFLIPDLFK